MRIIYTCPKCGCDLVDLCLTSNPPKYKKECFNCGWSSEIETQIEEIIRIPFGGNSMDFRNDNYTLNNFKSSPCTGCSNNPLNGGSGNCNCILGGSCLSV